MILYLYSIFLCIFTFIFSDSSFTPTLQNLTLTTKKIGDIPATQQRHFNMSDYFFSHLPQANLPQNLLTQIQAYYKPLLAFLPPVSSDQTAQERADQVMGHIEKFYGLLYTTALFEKGLKTPTSTTSTTPVAQLTLDDIYNSEIWQNYLKISVAEAYQKEQTFLTQLFCENQEIFKYLPNFELTYYNKKFVSLRNSTEITRLYLMLSEAIRKRLCTLVSDWAQLFKKSSSVSSSNATVEENLFQQGLQGFQAIKTFKDDDFFKNIEKLKNIDLTQTFPVAFNDPQGNPISFTDALAQYDFSTYFTYSTTTKEAPVPTQEFGMFFTITQDPHTQQYNCYFTGLGHAVFAQDATNNDAGFPYGKITYKVFKLAHGKTSTKAYFAHNKFYSMLFNGEPPQPTFGFFCFLTVSSIKYLHVDLTPLFTNEYLQRSLALIEKNRTSLPTFPSCINYAQDDYLLLKKINDLYQELQVDSTQVTNATPQHHSFWHAIKDGFEDVGHAFEKAGEAIADSAVGKFFKKIGLTVAHGAVEFATDVAHAAESFGDAVLSAAFAIKDEAMALYYGTCIFPMLASGFSMSVSDCLKHAAEYQHAVTKELTNCMKDLNSTVDDLGKAYEALQHVSNALVGDVIGIMDKKLGDDLTGMLDAVVDSAVTVIETGANYTIDTVGNAVVLTADAVQMVASTAALVLTGQIANPNAWEAIGKDGLNLVEDTVSALLTGLSLALHFISQELKDAMLCFSYIISFITEAIAVICATIEAAGMFLYTFIKTGNLGDAFTSSYNSYWSGYHAIEKYSVIISSVVGIAVLVAATVVTGGADIELTGPMMAMMALNIGMSATSVVSGVQSNLAAIQKQQRQEATVNAYKQYVIDNFSVAQGLLANRGVESLVQYKMLQDNTERSLLFYHNSYNQQINNTISQQAYSVGCYVNNLATPNWNLYNSPASGATTYPYDTSVSVQADVGQLYGFNTGRLTLSPSNGFALYNQGRDTFSQEALVDPIIIPDQNSKGSVDKQDQLETFWFQQKDLTFLPTGAALEGDVLWRVTAQRETPFYIGIYLTERAIDLGTLQTFFNNYKQAIVSSTTISYDQFQQIWKPFDAYNKYIVDFDNKAKIFALHRNPIPGKTIDQNNTAQLGIYTVNSEKYENNWAPVTWTPSSFKEVAFKRGVWYRMKASLVKENMTVSFWEIGDDAAYEKVVKNPTTTTSPLAQTTIAVEAATYVPSLLTLAPALKNYAGSMGFVTSGAAVEYKVLTPAPTITPTSIRTAEYTHLQNTLFAHTKPMEKDREIAWQHALQTALKPTYGTFVLSPLDEMNIITGMFIYYNSSHTPRDIITFFTQNANGTYTLNANPAQSVQGIVSLATGLTYNDKGTITGFIPNVRNVYEKQYASLPSQLNTEITNLQKTFLHSLQTPLSFANNTLTLIDVGNLSIFIYQGTSLLIPKTIDFYVAACASSTGITLYGLPLLPTNSHNTINAFISITTGMVYYIQTNNQTNTPLLPAPALTPGILKTMYLVNGNSTYTLYDTYKSYFKDKFASLLNQSYKAYQQYEATLAKEAAFENQLTNAINQATTAASNASTQANLLEGSNQDLANTTTSASQAATTAATQLQTLLNEYRQAVASSNATQINTIHAQAQQQLQATTQATTAANTAATNAQNAINQNSSTFNFGSFSTSSTTPSNSSSYSNFNSNFGSSDSFSSDDNDSSVGF